MAVVFHLYSTKMIELAILMRQHSVLVERQGTRDVVTGCLDMTTFDEMANERLLLAEKRQESLSLLFIDLDAFHWVESRFGQEMGNTVLQRSVRQIEQVLRQDDMLARYGADKFMVLLPGSGVDLAVTVAQRIRHAIASLEYSRDNENFSVTASVGLATLEERNERLELLKHRADRALYRAKYRGRDRIEIASGPSSANGE